MICIIKLDALFDEVWRRCLDDSRISVFIGNPDGVAAQKFKKVMHEITFWMCVLYIIHEHPFTAWQYRVYWR